MSEVAIIGLGNLIKGDDGIGIQVIREIEQDIPKEIEVIDGGTAGLNILNFMEQKEKIIVIDALNLGEEVGEVIELDGEKVPEYENLSLSAHDIDFIDALQIGQELGIDPEIKVIGVEIGDLKGRELSMDLSEKVKQAIPEVKQRIFDEIEKDFSKN
ncbi:hypothetical protein C9439_07700 [archaeon SCG-AAA382B04]|nr:hypothetical protein C9439_07700 [archaeon SCG-AAA382B04]